MSTGDEQNVECPLCMEPLELDDINFFPCTCGYQICRFCWHRIRTDENGLCPACRKQYPEDPADFKPLTQEELQKIKSEKRQKDMQRKQKLSENRKHLANVRVVQKNLVFVVGLSQRLADAEVLKRQEYFGKYGKIHKVVINLSTSYAGSQGPSASAYVTYNRAEDALRAIQAVNNIYVDGRTLKASLGTTKYCSHFLRGQQCPKPDCMYLHELGDEAASFTKEEMQQGKHQEYERKLHEQLYATASPPHPPEKVKEQIRKQASSPPAVPPQQPLPNANSNDAWPLLQSGSANSNQQNANKTDVRQSSSKSQQNSSTQANKTDRTNSGGSCRNRHASDEECFSGNCRSKDQQPIANTVQPQQQAATPTSSTANSLTQQHNSSLSQAQHNHHSPSKIDNKFIGIPNCTVNGQPPSPITPNNMPTTPTTTAAPTNLLQQNRLLFDASDSNSFFSSGNGFPHRSRNLDSSSPTPPSSSDWVISTEAPPLITAETLPVRSSTDWQEAFGFSCAQTSKDDDLGFDPWDESSKALADLMEKESSSMSDRVTHFPNNGAATFGFPLNRSVPHINRNDHRPNHLVGSPRRLAVPPGFSSNHASPLSRHVHRQQQQQNPLGRSKMIFMNLAHNNAVSNGPNNYIQEGGMQNVGFNNHVKDRSTNNVKALDTFTMKEWQESLRALLPNINTLYSTQNQASQQQKGWNPPPQTNMSWIAQDPAIVSSGNPTDSRSDSPPHWMRSLQQLTEIDSPAPYNNHRLPFTTQFAAYRHH